MQQLHINKIKDTGKFDHVFGFHVFFQPVDVIEEIEKDTMRVLIAAINRWASYIHTHTLKLVVARINT